MSQHTPGPWQVCESGSWDASGNRTRLEYFVRPVDDITSIAVASDVIDHFTGKPSEANARLIASAPELLEALEEMVSVGCEFYDMDAGENGGPLIDKALAAIAKAKGEA